MNSVAPVGNGTATIVANGTAVKANGTANTSGLTANGTAKNGDIALMTPLPINGSAVHSDDIKKYSQELDQISTQQDVGKSGDNAGTTDDPWGQLPTYEDDGPKWSDYPWWMKILRVSFVILKICIVLGLLYFFICSIDIMGSAFQLIAGRTAGELFTQDAVINIPVCGLMLGILVTVMLQSSSTSTSIIVTMVAAGVLPIRTAIPIIMGCNIGTTVTNTIVSLGQAGDKDQFRRAFGGATVHDMFNWSTVCILLPLEVLTGYLFYLTQAMVQGIQPPANPEEPQFLKVITQPFTNLIIQLDKKVITAIAEGNEDISKRPLIKYWNKEYTEQFCEFFPLGQLNETFYEETKKDLWTKDFNVTDIANSTVLCWTDTVPEQSTYVSHLFFGCGQPGAPLNEVAVGVILLISSLFVLLLSLILMVKILQSMLKGPALRITFLILNAEFPGIFAFLTGYLAILVGAILTVLVQSSSVFTSILTPLVGVGVITVDRMYPLTLGSNIGTTITGILAALAGDNVQDSMQVALCHLFFNISGILIFYPVPCMRSWPIGLAKSMGNITADHRWFPGVYLFGAFFFLPAAIFGLGVAGWQVLVGVGVPILNIIVVIVFTNYYQGKVPQFLPPYLRNWDFLPLWLRSFTPYDELFGRCRQCRQERCKCCRKDSVNAVHPNEGQENAENNVNGPNVKEVEETTGATVSLEPQHSIGSANQSFVVDEVAE